MHYSNTVHPWTYPEDSNFTSIKHRLKAHIDKTQPKGLLPFAGYYREPMPEGVPFNELEYFELIDQTAREQREGKTGFIDRTIAPILERLGLTKEQWYQSSTEFEDVFSVFVGGTKAIESVCDVFSKHWVNLQSHCRQLL